MHTPRRLPALLLPALLLALLFISACNRTQDEDPIFIPPAAEGVPPPQATPTPAPTPVPSTFGGDNAHTARRLHDETRAFLEQEAGELWGIPLYTPFVLWCRNTRYAVANYPDPQGVLFLPYGPIFKAYLPAYMVTLRTPGGPHYIDVGRERWPVISWFANPPAMGQIVNELFSWHLPTLLGAPRPTWDNSHMRQEAARVSVQLEIHALIRAMRTASPDVRRDAVTDALSIRTARHAQFPHYVAEETRAMLWQGLLRYTRSVLDTHTQGIVDELENQWLPPDGNPFRWGQSLGDNLQHDFPATTGALYALLLDAIGVAWRQSVHENTDLSILLAAHMAIPETDLRPLADIDLQQYLYLHITSRERTWAEQNAQLTHEVLTALHNYPAIFFYPEDYEFGNFIAGHVTVLDIGMVFFNASGLVGSFGRLELSTGGHFVLNPGPGLQPIWLLAPGGFTTEGNTVTNQYWVLTLNDNYELLPHNGNYRVAPR